VEVQEGEGWRLVIDPARQPFPVLLGGGEAAAVSWAVELTAPEAETLAEGVRRLAQQHHALVDQLMAEEALELELETPCGGGFLWLALEGNRSQWRLRFVLSPATGQRAVEGGWGVGASQALAGALEAALDGALRMVPP